MKVEPIHGAMEHVDKERGRPRYVLLTPHGRIFDQERPRGSPAMPHLALVCGRYEGVDERILSLVDDEVSIGDYVLSGGEAAALVVIDAVSRLIPGVLGNEASPSTRASGRPARISPVYAAAVSSWAWRCRRCSSREITKRYADGGERSPSGGPC